MFTGIVAAVGKITSIVPLGNTESDGVRLTIDASSLDLTDVELGDSIAIQGACMTVVHKTAGHFSVDVSRESLRLTVGLDRLGEVNLEKALRANDRLGGHLVSGHVDGLGRVTAFHPVGESYELRIMIPSSLAAFLAYKGSITINGVSLTVNQVHDHADYSEISINLIPHTLQVTTLKHLHTDAQVNLEVDLIARYVERMLTIKHS